MHRLNKWYSVSERQQEKHQNTAKEVELAKGFKGEKGNQCNTLDQ